MIDIVTLPPLRGTITGPYRVIGAGFVQPTTTERVVVKFPLVEPPTFARYMAGDIFAADGLQRNLMVRFADSSGNQFFLNSALEWAPVNDDGDWTSQSSGIHDLSQLDLWTSRSVQLIVSSIRDASGAAPIIGHAYVLLDSVAQSSAVEQVIRHTASSVGDIDIPVRMAFTATEKGNSFSLINERNYAAIVGVAVVNDEPRLVSVAGGTIEIKGPPINVGDRVVIEVTVKAPVTVRRDVGSNTNFVTPAWFIQDLVTLDGATNGTIPEIMVGPYRVERGRADLRITVRGVGARQSDALSMRAALTSQSRWKALLTSGREINVVADGLVEMRPGQANMLPECTGKLVAIVEHVTACTKVSEPRTGSVRAQTAVNFTMGKDTTCR